MIMQGKQDEFGCAWVCVWPNQAERTTVSTPGPTSQRTQRQMERFLRGKRKKRGAVLEVAGSMFSPPDPKFSTLAKFCQTHTAIHIYYFWRSMWLFCLKAHKNRKNSIYLIYKYFLTTIFLSFWSIYCVLAWWIILLLKKFNKAYTTLIYYFWVNVFFNKLILTLAMNVFFVSPT